MCVFDHDVVLLTPGHSGRAAELRVIIHPEAVGCSPNKQDLIENRGDALGCEGNIDLHVKRLPVVVVDHVESPEAMPSISELLIKSGDQAWLGRKGCSSTSGASDL